MSKKKLSFTLGKGACANFGKTHTHKRTHVCAIRILAKRTRACDVRAAENRVCECAFVRGKNSSKLTVWKLKNLTLFKIGSKISPAIARKIELQFSLKKPGCKVNFLKILIKKSDFRCHQMKI
jgi:hypothetical protein